MDEVVIERASPAALAACFALLPGLAAPDALMFTARDADGTLAGAGGLLWRSWGDPPAMPGKVVVLPDRRRRGIGRALLDRLVAAAAEEDSVPIALDPVDDEGEEAAFLRACGAVAIHRQFYFAADPRQYRFHIEGIVARLAAHGRIPHEARAVPLAEAPIDEVKWLVAHEMAQAPPLIEQLLATSLVGSPETAPIDRERSCVLMMGDAVAGALLSRRGPEANASAVVCNVVAPRWRSGWANALLLDQFTRRANAGDCHRMAFDCAETVRDTIGLARRSKADRTAIRTRFGYAASARPA